MSLHTPKQSFDPEEPVQKSQADVLQHKAKKSLLYTSQSHVRAVLESLAESGDILLLTPESIQEGLKKFGSRIPTEEFARMNAELNNTSSELLAYGKNIKEHSEYKTPPVIGVLPKVIEVQGELISLTVGNTYSKNPNSLGEKWKAILPTTATFEVVTEFVSQEIMDKQWGDSVSVYPAASLDDSGDKEYDDQVKIAKETLSKYDEKDADMFLMMVMHYVATGQLLMDYSKFGAMRLHTKAVNDPTNAPLSVYSKNNTIWLSGSNTFEHPSEGISCVIRNNML